VSLAILKSRALAGMHAPEVTVEVHLANGLPTFNIVGLPETEVKESKDRVRAAILTGRFEFPSRRIIVNLAPADLPKESGRFDLPIALGILAASGQIPSGRLADYEYAGELSLSGELRPIRGALAMTYALTRQIEAPSKRSRGFILPSESASEAALVADADIYPAKTLLDVCAHLSGAQALTRQAATEHSVAPRYPDLSEVKGQAAAKRALEVAASGGHSILMIGPPGTGKSMLAVRFAGLLPPMTEEEAPCNRSRAASRHNAGASGHFAARITRRPVWPWWAAAVCRGPVKSRSRIMGFCFWTSCPSSTGACSRCCASRSNRAASRFRARHVNRIFPRASNWWPP